MLQLHYQHLLLPKRSVCFTVNNTFTICLWLPTDPNNSSIGFAFIEGFTVNLQLLQLKQNLYLASISNLVALCNFILMLLQKRQF
jgi:hypothetical protein